MSAGKHSGEVPCGGDAFYCKEPGCPHPDDVAEHAGTPSDWTGCWTCVRAERNGGKCAPIKLGAPCPGS